MISTVVFFPAILVTVTDLLVVALCCFALRLEFTKLPSLLVLLSSLIGFVISVEVLLLKIEKALGISIFPQNNWAVLTTINRYSDLCSRFLFLLGLLSLTMILISRTKNASPTI
jgi:hypothetical protein